MFVVHFPASMLWHPAVHHCLLLLRALQQPHTLVLEPAQSAGSAVHRPPVDLLSNYTSHLRICAEAASTAATSPASSPASPPSLPGLTCVRNPEHVAYFFTAHAAPPAVFTKLQKELPEYLETVTVTSHIMTAVDALVFALSSGDMELTRQSHAHLLNVVERLDDTFQDEAHTDASARSSSAPRESESPAEPLSTWPLYTTLAFLIEQGGLLTSALPRLHRAYEKLRHASDAVRQHERLVQRTLDLFNASSSPVLTTSPSPQRHRAYPQSGFFLETQRRLAAYTGSTEARMTFGVTGDKGPLVSRSSGARLGLQAVPARLPWTLNQVPLKSPSQGNPATRQFLATHLPFFNAKYPQVKIDLRPRFWPESSITGVYRDGSEKSYCTKYLSSMGINVRFHKLVNEANDSNQPFSASHVHFQRRSVQGTWNPWLWSFEGPRARHRAPPRWDRKLTEPEWDHYTEQYSAQMKAEEEAIAARVRRYTDIPEASTQEVQERWRQHVTPRLQTDMEYNLNHWKRQHARGASPPAPVKMEEYSLFSVPDHTTLGQDTVDLLRRREAQHLEDWWRQRKEQLKPPR